MYGGLRMRYLAPFTIGRDELLARMDEEMNKFIDGFFTPGRGKEIAKRHYPKADVYREGNDLIIQAVLPFAERKDISLEIKDSTEYGPSVHEVIISGSCKQEENKDREYIHRELRRGRFTRTFYIDKKSIKRLPDPIAALRDGILNIIFREAFKEQKPEHRQIQIT